MDKHPTVQFDANTKSIDTKDKFLFDKYVDTNEINEEAVEDLSKIFIEEMDVQESYEYSFDPQVFTAGLVSLFQPAIENAIDEGFEEFWEDEVELVVNQKQILKIILISSKFLI